MILETQLLQTALIRDGVPIGKYNELVVDYSLSFIEGINYHVSELVVPGQPTSVLNYHWVSGRPQAIEDTSMV